MRLKNDFKEIIKHNSDYLFLRFLVYFLLAAFVFLFFVFRRIQNPSPLVFSEKLLYCSSPIVALIGILAILFHDMWFIQSNNNRLMNLMQQKTLQYPPFYPIIEWIAGTGFSPSTIQGGFIYNGYKILVGEYVDNESRNKPIKYVLLRSREKRITKENYNKSFHESTTIVQDRWFKLNQDELETELLIFTKWFDKNNVSPEYTSAGEPLAKTKAFFEA